MHNYSLYMVKRTDKKHYPWILYHFYVNDLARDICNMSLFAIAIEAEFAALTWHNVASSR